MAPQVASVVGWYSRIYLGGVPQLIRDETAFLSFVCMLAGIEALAGYREPDRSDKSANGRRFMNFVRDYFPPTYRSYAANLWKFRNGMAHGFSPRRFVLTHHNSLVHFQATRDGAVVLNAEDFYAAFLHAAQHYFADLAQSSELQDKFLKRIGSSKGGGFAVGFVDHFEPPASA
jgi:hypothetical protein